MLAIRTLSKRLGRRYECRYRASSSLRSSGSLNNPAYCVYGGAANLCTTEHFLGSCHRPQDTTTNDKKLLGDHHFMWMSLAMVVASMFLGGQGKKGVVSNESADGTGKKVKNEKEDKETNCGDTTLPAGSEASDASSSSSCCCCDSKHNSKGNNDPIPRSKTNDWITAISKGNRVDVFQALSGIETAGDRINIGDPIYGPMILFSGTTTPDLAEEIATHLKTKLGNLEVKRFRDGEIDVKVHDNVRGCDCFVIQSTSKPVNESIMELLLIVSSLRRASATRITAVIPYYGYKRDIGRPQSSSYGQHTRSQIEQAILSKKTSMEDPRVPISAADVAVMLETLGVDRIVSVDLQPPGQGQIEGFFSSRVPVDNLRSTVIAVNHFAMKALSDPVVVAANETCIEMAQDFRSALSYVMGGKSIGVAATIDQSRQGESRHIDVVGDIEGKDVIIVDDLVDTSGSLQDRVRVLKECGARNIYCFCVHGLLNGEAVDRIANMPIQEIALTNTVPWEKDSRIVHVHKFACLSVAPLLAEAIQRLHNGESLQHLRIVDSKNVSRRYRDQPEDDQYQ